MDFERFPEILERKRTLAGQEKIFPCRVLDRAAGALTVLFMSTKPYRVADLELPAGTITFGHFWTARPYNVYHWLAPGGATLAYYFNVADETVLGGDSFSFRDLAVDVLARPGGPPAVLDADEVPPKLDAATRTTIARGLASVLGALGALERGLEARAAELWPQVFAEPRGSARR